MRDNALYFPLISVPQSRWAVSMLLYWDTLGSIVPLDHTFARTNDEFMRELVQRKLVTPIFPSHHLYQIPDYQEAFLEYVKPKAAKMRQRFATLFEPRSEHVPIHLEKMVGISDELQRLGLARRMEGDWYDVDLWVANHLMTYLAAALGRLESVGAAPVTDDAVCFQLLAGNANLSGSESRLTARAAILENILPVPVGPLDLTTLAAFKSEQGKRLGEFRREIENRCILIAQVDPADREDALTLAVDDLSKERDKIIKKMKNRWSDVVLGPLYSIVGAGIAVITKPLFDPVFGTIAITGAGTSLISAIHRAYRANQDYVAALNKPMAYAAAFKKRLTL